MAGLGLVNLWSAVHERQGNLFTQQISWLGLGAAVFLGVAAFDYRNIARLGYVLHVIGVALLLAVLVGGKMVGGGRRWFDLGAVPPAALRADAAADDRRAGQVPERLAGAGGPDLAPPGDPGAHRQRADVADREPAGLRHGVPAAADLLQHHDDRAPQAEDAGRDPGAGDIAAFPIYQHLLREYQRKRVEAFFNPNSEGAYQARQALNAIGSGRFFGKGYLHGTQIRLRHFPALWTDFPFAVWAEEWGFVGCFVLLLAYMVVMLWILKIAGEARDRFGATVCVGVAAMIFWHVIINIGMVSGTLPVVGVTLPLISYGGSSILTTAAALGLVMNVSVRRFSY